MIREKRKFMVKNHTLNKVKIILFAYLFNKNHFLSKIKFLLRKRKQLYSSALDDD